MKTRCRDVMKRKVVVCREDETASHCAKLMRDQNIGFLPVVGRNQRVVGVVTDRDLVLRLIAERRPYSTPVVVVMSREVQACRPQDDLETAEAAMAAARKSRLVVVDEDGHALGVISLSDIAQAEPAARAGRLLHAVTEREAPALRG